MKLPRQTHLQQDDTHRLIPYRYSDRDRPILNLLAQDDDDLLRDLTELEGATNDRLLAETDAARQLGIFGSPTFVVERELFWGDDRIEDAISWHRHGEVRGR